MNKPIYLDNQSTTPLDPKVLEAMLPYLKNKFGNASSIHHSYGRESKRAVEDARAMVAQSICSDTRDIIFTSGATESINLALKGLCQSYKGVGHIITQNTEHRAVLDTCQALEREGWDISYLPVDKNGFIKPRSILNAIRKETALVAIMHANNEIGTIQSIEEIGDICKRKGITFFVDASQSFGRLDIDVQKMKIDILAATAHKIYGPKGVGFLYVRQKSPKVTLKMQIDGGGHERGLRSGTLAVHQIIGLAKAVEVFIECKEKENEQLRSLRDKMFFSIKTAYPQLILNGSSLAERLPNNLNICFPGIEAESLIMKMKGIACSTGSACSGNDLEPSHVIRALGRDTESAHSAIRFSLGRFNTEAEIDGAIEEIINTLPLFIKD